jgi:hypothetical protein
MGIMAMIAKKKAQMQEHIRERQYIQYQSNTEKLKLARADRHEAQLQANVRNAQKERRSST